jgi:hypothetical protein
MTLLREAAQLALNMLDTHNGNLPPASHTQLRLVLMAALARQEKLCTCGEPTALGIVHRADKACLYYVEK